MAGGRVAAETTKPRLLQVSLGRGSTGLFCRFSRPLETRVSQTTAKRPSEKLLPQGCARYHEEYPPNSAALYIRLTVLRCT